MKRRSTKREAQERQYRKRVREWLPGKRCLLHAHQGISHPAEECHHKKGRQGALLLDERFWVPLCHSAHQWVTEHPAEAIRLGYSASRLAREDVA